MPTDAEAIAALRRAVVDRFGAAPGDVRVVRSPYRICPLGAHIDHQLGPVTAMALDRSVLLAFAPSKGREVRLGSLDFEGEVAFSLDHVIDKQPGDWGNYPRGAVRALANKYTLERGVDGVVTGPLQGGGVSSSAAVGVAYLLALEAANGLDVSPVENIDLDLAIENRYLGLRNGILDQAAILLSRRGCLTRINCRDASHEVVAPGPVMPPFRVLLAFSGIRQALVNTDYNRRVAECTEAAERLLAAVGRPGSRPVLSEVTPEDFERRLDVLTERLARRACHYFSEVERVGDGVAAWRAGDLATFGQLMTMSGNSSVYLYECGSPPLIDLFESLADSEGVYGARFSGAGFRGCCVALVRPEAADDVGERIMAGYRTRHPELAEGAYHVVCGTADAAGIMEDS